MAAMTVHELIDTIEEIKKTKKKLEDGQVPMPGSHLHLALIELEQVAATMAVQHIRNQPRSG